MQVNQHCRYVAATHTTHHARLVRQVVIRRWILLAQRDRQGPILGRHRDGIIPLQVVLSHQRPSAHAAARPPCARTVPQ